MSLKWELLKQGVVLYSKELGNWSTNGTRLIGNYYNGLKMGGET